MTSPLRQIRSFVLRTSRLTDAQSRALETDWPQRGWDADGPFDALALYGREAPLWIEIGIGNGDALLHAAKLHPEVNFLGIEVHTPGVGHCLLGAAEAGLTNLRLTTRDAVDVLRDSIAENSVDQLNLFFPDPWHKKRHHKRRIVSPAFCQLVASRLRSDGLWHMATDWADYGQWMRDTLAEADDFVPARPFEQASERPAWRPETRFERRGLKLGHHIEDLLYRRAPRPANH